MIHKEFVQGSDEWLQFRTGKISASQVWRIMPGKTGKYTKERENYKTELALEILTGERAEQYENEYMRRGTELEPEARAEYEMIKDMVVYECGCLSHESISDFIGSPDGIDSLENIASGIEIKCRTATNQIQEIQDILKSGMYGMDRHALFQCQALMSCCDAEYWDYVLYNPDIKLDYLQIYIYRVKRDKAIIQQIESEVMSFKAELTVYIKQLKELETIVRNNNA